MAFADESGFTENPPPTYAWAKPGEPHAHEMKTGTRKRLNAIGACDARLAPLSVWFVEGRVGGSEFREWAQAFANGCDPGRPTHLWLDNGPTHTAEATRACFARWAAKGLIVHFLPAYCPELNRIEILWRLIKKLRPFALLEMDDLRICLKNILRQMRKSNSKS